LARIGNSFAAAKIAGWPGDGRGGILLLKKEYPACGGGMPRSFEHVLDLNRPSQPRMSDLPCKLEILKRRPDKRA
jgi:hypothetical protein